MAPAFSDAQRGSLDARDHRKAQAEVPIRPRNANGHPKVPVGCPASGTIGAR